jgi:hypothetical protein
MRERPMQDALLCYYIVANMFRAGYFADAAKLVRRALARRRAFFGLTDAPARSAAQAPAVFRELEEWAQRLTRMESYVESMA